MREQWPCTVCGESVDESTSSICSACGEHFHLNQRNDQEGKDCGNVWISEQYFALEFACRRCLTAAAPRAPAEPRIRRPKIGRRRYRRRD